MSTNMQAEPRRKKLMIVANSTEYELFQKAAARADIPIATFVREAAVASAEAISKMPSTEPCQHGTKPGVFCFKCGKRVG